MIGPTWRILGVLVVVVGVFYSAWWIVVPIAFALTITNDMYELLALGFCIDVYYAAVWQWPFYTTCALGLIIAGMVIRPWLMTSYQPDSAW